MEQTAEVTQDVILIIKNYLDSLVEKSTPENPIWNKEENPNNIGSWNYVNGCIIKVILKMYNITSDKKYLDFADGFIDFYINADGSIKTINSKEYNVDRISEGKILFSLFELTGKEKYRKAIDTIYKELKSLPKNNIGNIIYKPIYPNKVWLEGLYMVQPFYMEYETKYNRFLNYKDIYTQFLTIEKLVKDPATGLLYNGYSLSSEISKDNKSDSLNQKFWARGIGWYIMALVDVLEEMSEVMFYEFRFFMDNLKNAIDALISVQSETGMWNQTLNNSNDRDNFLETSASSMISYAILKSTRLGFIPKRYEQYGTKCFFDICNRYLEVGDNGMTLGGISLFDINNDIQKGVIKNNPEGIASFLMAFSEIYQRV